MKKSLYFLLLFCPWHLAVAQDLEDNKPEINSDRPGHHTEAKTVGKGIFQVETGFKFIKESKYYRKEREFQYPKMAFRYGLSNKFELRLQAQVQQNLVSYKGTTSPHLKNKTSGTGINNIRFGTKFLIHNNSENGNFLALQFETRLPLETEQFRTRFLEPELKLAIRNELSDYFSYLINLGFDIQDPGGDNLIFQPTPVYAFALQFSRKDLLLFGELFGQTIIGDSFQHCSNFGLAYRLAENLQVDVSAGLPLSEEAPDLFISGGITFRLPK